MKPAFLTWLFAQRKANARIAKQYRSNLPKGIV
jgi:hypothetical protein